MGIFEPGEPHLLLVRSKMLLESARRCMLGFRREPKTKTVRKLAGAPGYSKVASLEVRARTTHAHTPSDHRMTTLARTCASPGG